MLGKIVGHVRQPVVLLVVAAGVLLSGCAIGFRVPATDITTTSATLNGYVGSNRSEQGEWFFRYGKTTVYGSETQHQSIQFTEWTRHDVSEPVSGLEPGTTYHQVLCADDQEPGVEAFCSADHTFTTRPTGDFVNGSGVLFVFGAEVRFTVTVHGGPGGENATGFLEARSDDDDFNFDSTATCMNVSGSEGTVGVRIDTGSSAGSGFMAAFRDREGMGTSDQALWFNRSTDPPGECAPPGSAPPGSTVGPVAITGDVEVVDAAAPSAAAR